MFFDRGLQAVSSQQIVRIDYLKQKLCVLARIELEIENRVQGRNSWYGYKLEWNKQVECKPVVVSDFHLYKDSMCLASVTFVCILCAFELAVANYLRYILLPSVIATIS